MLPSRSRPARARGSRPMRHLGLLLSLGILGASPCTLQTVVFHLPTAAGLQRIDVALPGGTDLSQVTLALDGADVTSAFAPGGIGLVGTLPVPPAGAHRLSLTRVYEPLPGLPVPFTNGFLFDSPAAAPDVASVEPASGVGAPRSAWIRFRLAAAADSSALSGWGFGIECNGQSVARSAYALADGALILNPSPELPAGSSCRVAWRKSDGHVAETTFQVAANAAGGPGTALYDRSNPLSLAPFPDDYYTVADPTLPSGIGIDLPLPPFSDAFQQQAFQALVGAERGVDGWSRQPPIVLAFSHALDPSASPADEFASQDPFAPIALVDIDPASPDYQKRVPYHMTIRSDPAPAGGGGGIDNVALLFPTIDLRERGHYALVVTRRAFATATPGRPFGPSAFFASVLAPPAPADATEVVRARDSIDPVLDAVAALPDVPIPREDVALAVRLSIRTQPSPADLVAVKEMALASPPPPLLLPDVNANPCPNPTTSCIQLLAGRALSVRGKVRLPNFRTALGTFEHDPTTGRPVQTGTNDVPFVLTLPLQSLSGPVIPLMYQHGNPGSPNEIFGSNNEQLDDAGFALTGMQDTLNREIGQDVALQTQVIFFFLVQAQQLPDFWNQTGADMIFFLRAIQGMGSLDLIHRDANGNPALGGDGSPEIDPSTILYKGISEGANNAQRFLPFAPEILAAETTVGGARLGETLIHQSADTILQQIGGFLPKLRPVELWVGLSLFQAAYDPQDGHSYLRHLYREPLLPFAGSTDVTPPSTIWTQGIGDSLVPNNATYAMVREMGIPHVRPIAHAVPTLQQVDPPLRENIAPGITSGFFQFDPATTPGCAGGVQPEGHFCPQSAPIARAQRLHFLLTALQGSPEIVDPF
jgi:hypothetical protein